MATSRTPSPKPTAITRLRRDDADEDEASLGELVEHALAGARDLATHEATLALVELEHDMRLVRTAVALAFVGGTCAAVSIAWAGVAIALALHVGALGLGIAAIVLAAVGVGVLVLARRQLPQTLLGKSRARLERRIARVTETLR